MIRRLTLMVVPAASVGVSYALIQLPGGSTGPAVGLALVSMLCAASLAYSTTRERDPLAPLILVSGVFLVLYVLRPIYILVTGIYGPTRNLDDLPVTAEVESAMTHGLALVAAGLASLLVGYLTLGAAAQAADWRTIAVRARERTRDHLTDRARIYLVTGFFAVISLAVYYRLVRGAGGFGAYLTDLSTRSAFFFGRGYLADASLPLKVATLIILASLLAGTLRAKPSTLYIAALVAAVSAEDFLSGGRANLLLGTLLPAVILIHYLRRPLSRRAIGAILALGLVLFLGSRIVTRDSIYLRASGPESRVALLEHALTHLPASTLGSREAVPFDSLVVLLGTRGPVPPLQLGKTYEPIASFVVPRALWRNKPLGGGNAWFTSSFFPEFYGPGHVETSLSFIGESYANFGGAGVILLCFLYGSLMALAYRRLRTNGGVLFAAFYAVTLGYFMALLRGDAFHSVTSWMLTAILLRLLWGPLRGHTVVFDHALVGRVEARMAPPAAEPTNRRRGAAVSP